MVSYNLHELSFREFLFLETGIEIPIHNLADLIENHAEISGDILQQFQPLPLFEKYLKLILITRKTSKAITIKS